MTEAEETALAFAEALNAGRWREAAARVLPTHAERHRLLELWLVLVYARERELGAGMDVVLPWFPHDREPDVDEGDLRRLSGQLVPGYRGAATVGDVAEIPAVELMAQVLENLTRRRWGFPTTDGQVYEVGRVVEEGDSARMFYRIDSPAEHVPGEGPHLREMEMRREGGRWYVLPRADTLFAGAGIQVVHRWTREAEMARAEQKRASGF